MPPSLEIARPTCAQRAAKSFSPDSTLISCGPRTRHSELEPDPTTLPLHVSHAHQRYACASTVHVPRTHRATVAPRSCRFFSTPPLQPAKRLHGPRTNANQQTAAAPIDVARSVAYAHETSRVALRSWRCHDAHQCSTTRQDMRASPQSETHLCDLRS